MMFRGTERFSADAYNDVLKRLGADSNAFTTDDYTNYYIIGPSSELETMMDIESDRFENLEYGEQDFRTEALAVLGEYNKNASGPFLPMYEKMRALAFEKHTYEHTTMGFLEDIQAMPEYYDYSLRFFDRFYRPENTVLLVVGDVTPERVFPLARTYYGGWKKGYQPVTLPTEPPQTEKKTARIDWPAPIRPYLMMGWRSPAFDAGSTDTAALHLISQLLFGESAPLYQQLVVDEQWVDFLDGSQDDRKDPYLFTVYTRVKSEELLPEVEEAIASQIAKLQEEPVDAARLERIKEHLRYSFALDLDSPGAVAFTVADFLSLTGDPSSINQLFEQYRRVTPADIQRLAREIFQDRRQTVVTLSHEAPAPVGAEAAEAAEAFSDAMVTLPAADSPLVAVRLMFTAGSIYDPPGKEGLAALTGLMVGQAGTAERSYTELVDALYPLAASIDVATDREVTVISGQVHRDTLEQYLKLLAEVVLTPGFDESDFTRNKEQLLSYLTTTLRATNDELLGLEALQQRIFAGHPYGHSPAGTVQGLASLTLDDVRTFYAEHFTRSHLMLGLAGGYPEGFETTVAEIFSKLPAGEGAPGSAIRPLPEPPPVPGRDFLLIEKDTDSVGIHFGFPLPVNRADPDYYPLMVANSFLGEHRTFHGRLMQQLRGQRGLNYGDYSYIEYWDAPPYTSTPTPNVPRRQQYFSVWVRPVVPKTAHFALRAALYEVDRLIERGLTQQELDLTREFLVNYSRLWAQTLSDRLGFQMDSDFYQMPDYIDEIERRLASVTVEDVRRVVEKYLQTQRYRAVIVTRDAEAMKTALLADEPSPITYESEKPESVLEADRVIEKLPVAPTTVEIVPVEAMFEK
jgi:zinc protease